MATYAGIVERVRQYTLDNEAPLVATVDPLIDSIIARAERRISRDLDTDAMVVTSSQAMSAGEHYLGKPPGLVAASGMRLDPLTGGPPVALELRSLAWTNVVYPVVTSTGRPRWYCNVNHEFWRIAPALDADYTAVLVWMQTLGGLSADNPVTWLSANQDELLLKAILAECEVFHRNAEARALYEADYAAELKRINELTVRNRADWSLNSPLPIR